MTWPASTAKAPAAVNCDLLQLYALWWDLSEVGGYLAYFRSHHADNADAYESWNNLQCFIAADQRWPN